MDEAWRAFKAQNTGPGVALSGRSSYRTLMQRSPRRSASRPRPQSARAVTYTDLENFTEFEFLPATDEYRDLLMFAHQIYAEGLTNVDIFTRDHSQWWPDVVAGHDFTWADCFSRSSYARINAAEGGVDDRRGGSHHADGRQRQPHLVQDDAADGQAADLLDRLDLQGGAGRHEVPELLVQQAGRRDPDLRSGVPGCRGLQAGGGRRQEGAGRRGGGSPVAGQLVA